MNRDQLIATLHLLGWGIPAQQKSFWRGVLKPDGRLVSISVTSSEPRYSANFNVPPDEFWRSFIAEDFSHLPTYELKALVKYIGEHHDCRN